VPEEGGCVCEVADLWIRGVVLVGVFGEELCASEGVLYPVSLPFEERARLVEDLLVGPGDVVSAWVAVALGFHVGECAGGVCGCGCGYSYSSLVTPAAKLLESACTCSGKMSVRSNCDGC